MQKTLVYDLPTRFFHWLFASCFIVAFFLAKNFGDDSPWFALHSLCGLMLAALVCLRALWGFFGTRHARFSGFALKPGELFAYLVGLLKGSKRLWAGHNPASSWAAVAMFLLSLGLVLTGFQIASGNEIEAIEEIHEIFANSFMIVAVFHIGGVILHSFRHRDQIAISMVTGMKSTATPEVGISSHRTFVGFILLMLAVVWGGYLLSQYDAKTGTLELFGTPLQLIEPEEEQTESLNDHDD